MTYELGWYKPQKVLKLTITGDFTIEELRQSGEEIRQYVQQSPSPIHLIADLDKMGSVPNKISELNTAAGSLRQLRSSIIIGRMNPMMRFFALVLSKLNGGYDVQIVNTMDEALIVLNRLDQAQS